MNISDAKSMTFSGVRQLACGGLRIPDDSINVRKFTHSKSSFGRKTSETSTLWIRTTAGPGIGFGHLRRTCVLGRSLQDFCSPLFLLDEEDKWSRGLLNEQALEYFDRGLENAWSHLPKPAAILIDTRNVAGLDRFIATAKERQIPVISIHDLGLELLPADIVIDGSVAPRSSGAVSANAAYHSGTAFMVLDPVYSHLHEADKNIREDIGCVFINLGGGNSREYYERVLEGLRLWGRDVEVIGVPGFVEWGQDRLALQDWRPLDFHWESRCPEQFLFAADLAITAGGLSAFESLCAGTPLLCLSYDHLQQITITKLAEAQACIDLGPGDGLDPEKLAGLLSELERDVARRISLSVRGRMVSDGRGAERVSQLIRAAMTDEASR